MTGSLRIGNLELGSRLIVGTGKYKDLEQTRAALEASGADMVTVAVRRLDLSSPAGDGLMRYLRERRKSHQGSVPVRRVTAEPLPVPDLSYFQDLLKGSGDAEVGGEGCPPPPPPPSLDPGDDESPPQAATRLPNRSARSK